MLRTFLFFLLFLFSISLCNCVSSQKRNISRTVETSPSKLSNTKPLDEDDDADDSVYKGDITPTNKSTKNTHINLPSPKRQIITTPIQIVGPTYNNSFSLVGKVHYKNTKYIQPKLININGVLAGGTYLRKTNFSAVVELENKMPFEVSMRAIRIVVTFANGKTSNCFKSTSSTLKPNAKQKFTLSNYFYVYDHIQGASIEKVIVKVSYIRKFKMILVKPRKSLKCVYSNRYFELEFLCDYTVVSLGFKIRNKSSKPISIVWDETSFISSTGESSKVMHKGIRFIRRYEKQSPTLIPPNSKYSDILIPSSHVYFSRILKRWSKKPMWLSMNGQNEVNAKFSFYMSFLVNNRKKRILFKFKALFSQPKKK